MWRISPISEDWVDKGCPIPINQVELAVRLRGRLRELNFLLVALDRLEAS